MHGAAAGRPPPPPPATRQPPARCGPAANAPAAASPAAARPRACAASLACSSTRARPMWRSMRACSCCSTAARTRVRRRRPLPPAAAASAAACCCCLLLLLLPAVAAVATAAGTCAWVPQHPRHSIPPFRVHPDRPITCACASARYCSRHGHHQRPQVLRVQGQRPGQGRVQQAEPAGRAQGWVPQGGGWQADAEIAGRASRPAASRMRPPAKRAGPASAGSCCSLLRLVAACGRGLRRRVLGSAVCHPGPFMPQAPWASATCGTPPPAPRRPRRRRRV